MPIFFWFLVGVISAMYGLVIISIFAFGMCFLVACANAK